MASMPQPETWTLEILALYEKIVPLLSHNPERLELPSQINAWLREKVWYDFYHYVMEDPEMDWKNKRLDTTMVRYIRVDHPAEETISLKRTHSEDPIAAFDRSIEENYRLILENRQKYYPGELGYHYYRIESRTPPQISLGFFRKHDDPKHKHFSAAEKQLFEQLSPHIFHLYRAALTQQVQSRAFQYFDSFAEIGSRIAREYGLSDAEFKLLPDILFGYATEEIADKHFIAVATVKTHIQHILKKTGSRSRLDFIGKFFTSPERVQLQA